MIGKSGQGTRCSFLVWIAQLAIYLFKQKQKKNIWTFILFIYFFDGILCLHETDGSREMTRSEGWEKWGMTKANNRANNILFNNSWTLRFFTCHLDLCQFFGSHLLPSKLWCSLVEFELRDLICLLITADIFPSESESFSTDSFCPSLAST